jgi:hypothetical protein
VGKIDMLNAQEFASLRLQIETSKSRGGRRYLPCVFTQEGIAMLSSVPLWTGLMETRTPPLAAAESE